jgi:hypothetical protein
VFVFLLMSALAVAGAIVLWPKFFPPADDIVAVERDRAAVDEQASETGTPDLPSGETGESPPANTTAGPSEAGTETSGGETGGIETGGGETGETGEGETGLILEGERPAPTGTFRGAQYITPFESGPTTDLAGAKDYCAGLASQRFAGEPNWSLANPAELKKFIGSSEIKRGKYWTTALHAGKAAVFSMPSGKKTSEKADRKLARPLCVTKY